MPLSNQVKRYREEKGISQTKLGKLCEVSRQTISSIERGDYHPSVVLALRIVSIFEKKVEDLFCWEDERNEDV